jgi:hypothetical protein
MRGDSAIIGTSIISQLCIYMVCCFNVGVRVAVLYNHVILKLYLYFNARECFENLSTSALCSERGHFETLEW